MEGENKKLTSLLKDERRYMIDGNNRFYEKNCSQNKEKLLKIKNTITETNTMGEGLEGKSRKVGKEN